MPVVATAQEYYTWVDAQGQIHNSPKPPSASSSTAIDPSSDTSKQQTLRKGSAVVESLQVIPGTNIPISPILPTVPSPQSDDYVTEDEFHAQQQQYEADNPAFYVWIDEQGIRRTQMYKKSAEVAAREAEQIEEEIAYDHLLAQPLRNVDSDGVACCQQYRSAFKHRLAAEERLVLSGFREQLLSVNGEEYYQAWYIQLESALAAGRDVLVKLRNIQQAPVVLALNAQWQPLHLVAPIVTHAIAGTWATQPYQESRLLLDDPEIQFIIVFFPQTQADNASIDLRWIHGKTPD